MRKILVLLCAAMAILWAADAPPARAQEAAPPAAPQSKLLSPETFLELRIVEDPQFSPDGTRVAFTVTEPWKADKQTRHVWLYDLTAKQLHQLTFSQKSESFPRWSPDGKRLAFLSDREGEHQQIYVLAMEGGEASAVTKGKASVSAFCWSPDGKAIAYLAPDAKTEAEEKKDKDKDDARVVDKDDKHARLRLVNPATLETRALTDASWEVKELEWLTDGQNIVIRATTRPAVEQFTDRIYSIAAKDGSKEELLAPRGPFSTLRVSPTGSTISFVGCREDGPSPHDLWLLPSSGGAARNLTGASLDRRIVDYRWAKGGWIVAVYADRFHSSLVGYSNTGEKKDMASVLPVNPGAISVAVTGEIAFVGQTTTVMQELWLRDTTGGAQQVTHFNDAWKNYGLIAPEIYKYKSFDGLEIEAGLLKPSSADGKSKLPTVVLAHGGPTGNWRDSIDPWGQLLAAHGFAVLYPNVRGSTGYGEKFTELNRGDWGGGDFKDVMAGVDDLIAKGIADPDRLGIAGWSYGGYMAEWAITQTTRFKAAVTGAGMSDLISEYGTEKNPEYDEWFWGVPYEKPEGFLNGSPFLYVKNAKTPTLILHGESDVVDPPGQSQELYRGLKRYNVPAEYVVYPREPHGFQEAKHYVDVHKRVIEWFGQYLKGEKPKDATPPKAVQSRR
ncbi:MAG TPA: S9 family peptidase [Candidatus Sulfotelmatobacter sp.]|nr:S9 family peptidase [Candidatus Sulfotelmatobacter sp.]